MGFVDAVKGARFTYSSEHIQNFLHGMFVEADH
jgi:hypothetical protein